MTWFAADMESSIGAFEAKAQLSRLLRAVEQGEHFTITVRGRPVADLVPHRAASSQGVAAAVEALQAFPAFAASVMPMWPASWRRDAVDPRD